MIKMKNLFLLICLTIMFTQCSNKVKQKQVNVDKQEFVYTPPPMRTITYYKYVKETKEVQETKTNYHYKIDWWNGKLKQQPNVYSESKYYIIFTDNTHEEVNYNYWLNYSKGDSIQFVKQIPI